jgi:serine/threonine-protein kinase HipA
MGVFFVYNDVYVGKCYWTEKRSRVTSVFAYEDGYLASKNNWNIDPSLSLITGSQASKYELPSAFLDAAPDRWGRTLIRHRHLRESKNSGKKARTINEVDYLLGVNDFARQGDLRFSLSENGVFEHPSEDIPKLVSLPKLLSSAHKYIEKQDDSAIAYLLDAGSASLGGARPKAAVYNGDELYIAKFPNKQDKWDVIAWEWVCLNVAAEAGIDVPENRLVEIDGENVLLLKRFDRADGKRVGYISAMTLLGLSDGEHADYSEIAEKLCCISVSGKADLHELFRRIVFSLLINNTDDHLRNHGFLRSGSGWRLSPVFDINPNPDTSAMRVTSVFTELEKEAALVALLTNANVFDLLSPEAEAILAEVTSSIKSCDKLARMASIKKSERELLLRTVGLE